MYQTILVPLDGTVFSERALPLATTIARATGSRLVLIRAAWAPQQPGMDAVESQQWAIREAQMYLESVAEGLKAQGAPVELSAPHALADVGILREIAVQRADLVVMASHRQPNRQHQIVGSIAQAVLSQSPVPTIVLRVEEHLHPSPRPHAPELIVPLDGSAFAETILPFAVDLAKALHWSLTLLRVLPVPGQPGFAPDRYLEEEAEAVSYLTDVAASLRKEGVRVKTEVKAGPPARTILEQCHLHDASMIAMATHGRTGVHELAFGSVTLAVLRESERPLLLIHPPRETAVQPATQAGLAELVPSR
ncbi:MAG: universal stress protein [Anaerolineae bacterium]|nr:universal stress protein [Anaerolineae bacterium]